MYTPQTDMLSTGLNNPLRIIHHNINYQNKKKCPSQGTIIVSLKYEYNF